MLRNPITSNSENNKKQANRHRTEIQEITADVLSGLGSNGREMVILSMLNKIY
jgi:hypothetical protein